MAQELDAQAVAQVRAFDETGDIGHHETAEIRELHHPKVGFEGSEGVVGNLRAGGRDARNEGGLAGVGETDQAHVGQEFQFEAEAFLIAGAAGFVLGGRLVGGGGEARVALAAFAAARHREAFAGLGEIVEALAGGFVVDHGADGHLDVERAALGAGPLAALAVTAALGLVLGVEAELEQGVLVDGGDQHDVAAAAAIAAARPAARDEFLTAEGQASVAAVARFYQNSRFVDEHGKKPPAPFETGGLVEKNRLADGSACPTYSTAVMLTNLPIWPRSLNSTTPVTLANSVSSLPQPTLRPGLILVPRCRTMMEPPGTSWPPKTFTPRRCAWESRPFRELPKPFLCAMRHLRHKVADLHFGEGLAVADGLLVLFLRLELEDDDFVAPAIADDGGLHGAAGQQLAVILDGKLDG